MSGSGTSDAASPLAAYLAAEAPDAELVAPGEEMPTVERAAAALGVPAGRIVKTIAFQHKRDASQVCLAVVPGDVRVDRGKVAAALGRSQLKLASAAATLEATGYAVGGVPPVGHRRPLPVVVDPAVLEFDEVFGGGGDEDHMVRLAPRRIVELTSATVADVSADQQPGGER